VKNRCNDLQLININFYDFRIAKTKQCSILIFSKFAEKTSNVVNCFFTVEMKSVCDQPLTTVMLLYRMYWLNPFFQYEPYVCHLKQCSKYNNTMSRYLNDNKCGYEYEPYVCHLKQCSKYNNTMSCYLNDNKCGYFSIMNMSAVITCQKMLLSRSALLIESSC